ncbi:MAG: hypothetical protein EPO37_00255 [Nitrosarchaeum sp.]|nr:MAG: hypothetical protein EPO37_00255 [Nitrosarchaeum sp.]
MKTRLDTLENKNYLLLALIGVVVVFLVANIANQEEFPIAEDLYMTDLLYMIFPGIVVVFGVMLVFRYRLRGNHGISWILFTLAIASWYVGEMTYEYDYGYDLENISTLTSDLFYIIGYPLFFGFTIFYLKPRKQIISKKMILISSLVSILFIIPSLYFTFNEEYQLDELTIFLYAIYPILDGVILIPSIIATFLFFRGQVNLLWSLILIATILFVIADTSYLVFSIEETYYPGHPVDILYVWSYILYAFGVLSHIRLYKKRSEQDEKLD